MARANGKPERDIILMGGSAGAIEALLELLKGLPPDFSASILIAVHTSADGPALLPRVLSRSALGMKVTYAGSGDLLQPRTIYVAPPDQHLLLGPDERILVRRGARENNARPAIDPLFRSAAAEGYGPRSIAVVLSGYLDDGSAGLYAVRRRGGLAIVQDPNDALAEEMPIHALQYAGADFMLPARQIGAKLAELAGSNAKVVTMKKKNQSRAAKPDELENPPNAYVAAPEESEEGKPSAFACPECHGVLWEIKEGGSVRYRCRTGHAYSEATLNEELSRAAESALWAAMRALEEKASMARRMADSTTGPFRWKDRLEEQAHSFATHAEMIRSLIFGEHPMGEVRVAAEEAKPELRRTGESS